MQLLWHEVSANNQVKISCSSKFDSTIHSFQYFDIQRNHGFNIYYFVLGLKLWSRWSMKTRLKILYFGIRSVYHLLVCLLMIYEHVLIQILTLLAIHKTIMSHIIDNITMFHASEFFFNLHVCLQFYSILVSMTLYNLFIKYSFSDIRYTR